MTRILDADEIADRVERLVHLDTQRARRGLDLTVERIARITGGGRLDFGGSEFEPAGRETLKPELAGPEDDYGWWSLDPGSYIVRYNERPTLDSGLIGRVLPLDRLLQAGASHPSFLLPDAGGPVETLLTVGDGGCRLKENCRISRLVVVESS
ncbi:MAG: deoxycytidine triphosphate deaminase [Gemmatimonadota bacterium]